MFSHVMLGTNDVERSKRFYDALMAAVGGAPGQIDAKGRVVYLHEGARLMLTPPIDGAPATGANGGTIGFSMRSPVEADRWHEAGLRHGGTPIEDPPGRRPSPRGPVYLAYLRDPDGNKLCALFPLDA